MKKGICCIVLSLEPLKFQTMTYKRFSSLSRSSMLLELGKRILNNMIVTNESIKYCAKHKFNYRLSSSLFPLITYDEADIKLENLPNYSDILGAFDKIKQTIQSSDVRVSCHPSEFNVLASENKKAVDKTIEELNFYGWFMTQIGCPLDYRSPINIHVNNASGDWKDIASRFTETSMRLSPDVLSRLVIENDDKEKCWSVKKLVEHLHPYGFPITFDYLHHSCHSDGMDQKEAFDLCVKTWGKHKPLFHYSESAPDQKNPRKHADFVIRYPETYNTDIDLDFEFKMKEKSFAHL
jgi:UV DNA damage endonuclease